MLALIKTIHEVMVEEKRDMYFVRFGPELGGPLGRQANIQMRRHLRWFEAKCLLHAAVAPRPRPMLGDFRYLAVYFDGTDDPRVVEYSKKFQDQAGNSLDPDVYQMVLYTYQARPADKGPSHADAARAAGEDFSGFA